MNSTMEYFGYPAAIIGSDIPQINRQALETAYASLEQGQNVLGPSDDGGYYLVGLAQPAAELFARISWGSDQVLEQTLQQAKRLSLDLLQLNKINDVDTWPELIKAAAEVPLLQEYLDQLKQAQS